jgi:hypothetical protein
LLQASKIIEPNGWWHCVVCRRLSLVADDVADD